jgi:tRNA/tmRNA/rRNA uracil-C5-methylase (TrmA/RlmC/RlmD family)
MEQFEEYFNAEIRSAEHPPRTLEPGECRTPEGKQCTLCHAGALDYGPEIAVKEAALRKFWLHHFPAIPRTRLVASPRGRGYRTVSKRKVFATRNGPRLGFVGPTDNLPPGGLPVVRCAIEPSEHAGVYAFLQESLAQPRSEPVAGVLTYVIIKGNYREQSLLFNVREISPAVVKTLNALSKSVTRAFPAITGVFVFEGQDDGRYYLEVRERRLAHAFRKIFGNRELFVRISGRNFLYPPLSFSQVNESILELFVGEARSLLNLQQRGTLYDLYCGYGLFALSLADTARTVVGVDLARGSVTAAVANAERQKVRNARFVRSAITAETAENIMKRSRREDAVILDPPRSGTAEGVIECIAAQKPGRILHIFCNSDILPAEIGRWVSSGYRAETAVPFDMFPGTSSLETLVLFSPAES